MSQNYEAILIVSFGGPEGMDDVMPFLENVLKGRNVPRERMIEVSHHYKQFNGISPLNEQNRQLIHALRIELENSAIELPVYWGNRNWLPLLPDTLRIMAADGVRKSLAFFTSAYSSYSGCRQYRENIEEARKIVGSTAPRVDKLRVFYNHPNFIEANCERILKAADHVDAERRSSAFLIFTAHSLPQSMATCCAYVNQLEETSRLIANKLKWYNWRLVYQSRSGPPNQPWLEPDVCETISELNKQGIRDIIIAPIGFVSDHMEILFDLDTEARELCGELGITMQLANTVGTHPLFISMIRELIQERLSNNVERPALGQYGPSHDFCSENCCLPNAYLKGNG